MKLILIIIVLILFLFKKNIESYVSGLPYPPPSSIERGSLCPISSALDDKFPYCRNGLECNNKYYPESDEIGRCL